MAFFIWPGVELEYMGIIYAVPVFVVNGWEWFDPEFMEKVVKVFGKGKRMANEEQAKRLLQGVEGWNIWPERITNGGFQRNKNRNCAIIINRKHILREREKYE